MKTTKLLFLACLLALISISKTQAGNAKLFKYDAAAIENQMAQLDQLEGYVLANPGVTLSQMTTNNNKLACLVSDPDGIKGFNLIHDNGSDIPVFLLGCGIGCVGIVIVCLLVSASQ